MWNHLLEQWRRQSRLHVNCGTRRFLMRIPAAVSHHMERFLILTLSFSSHTYFPICMHTKTVLSSRSSRTSFTRNNSEPREAHGCVNTILFQFCLSRFSAVIVRRDVLGAFCFQDAVRRNSTLDC